MKSLSILSILFIFMISGCSKQTQLRQEEQLFSRDFVETSLSNEEASVPVSNEQTAEIEENIPAVTILSPAVEIDHSSLYYHYRVFRDAFHKGLYSNNAPVDAELLTALSNEFGAFELSREKNLRYAIEIYDKLSDKYADETSFLKLRAAECYFRLKEYANAEKAIGMAVITSKIPLSDPLNSELNLYRSMLSYYYKNDYISALKYIIYIDTNFIYLPLQDFLVYKGTLLFQLNKYPEAFTVFEQAKETEPTNFYIRYDLLDYYFKMGKRDYLKQYAEESFQVLNASGDKQNRKKAYRQLTGYNSLMKKETWIYHFGFPESYEYNKNILYFCGNIQPINRIMSFGIQLPVPEKRRNASDMIYTSLFEDFLDFQNQSYYFLVSGILNVVQVTNRFPKMSPSIVKLVSTSNVAMVLFPTNLILSLSNDYDNGTNATNNIDAVSNTVMMQYLDFKYYLATLKLDINHDQDWDYLVIGFNPPNEAVLSVYYPAKNVWEKARFKVNSGDSQIIFQDVNQDGKNEILLLDDDVYFINLTQ